MSQTRALRDRSAEIAPGCNRRRQPCTNMLAVPGGMPTALQQNKDTPFPARTWRWQALPAPYRWRTSASIGCTGSGAKTPSRQTDAAFPVPRLPSDSATARDAQPGGSNARVGRSGRRYRIGRAIVRCQYAAAACCTRTARPRTGGDRGGATAAARPHAATRREPLWTPAERGCTGWGGGAKSRLQAARAAKREAATMATMA